MLAGFNEVWVAKSDWSDWLIIESADGSLEDMGWVSFKWCLPETNRAAESDLVLPGIVEGESTLPSWIHDLPSQAKIEWQASETRCASAYLRACHLDAFGQPNMPIEYTTRSGAPQKWWLGKAAYDRAKSAGLFSVPQQPRLAIA